MEVDRHNLDSLCMSCGCPCHHWDILKSPDISFHRSLSDPRHSHQWTICLAVLMYSNPFCTTYAEFSRCRTQPLFCISTETNWQETCVNLAHFPQVVEKFTWQKHQKPLFAWCNTIIPFFIFTYNQTPILFFFFF